MSESTNVCRECGADLLFSARARGNGLCGPCTRAAGQWPYGPPDHHEECCLLHKGGGYCDCKASDASDSEFGLGHSASPGSSGEAG
jgi:hypothetical protein